MIRTLLCFSCMITCFHLTSAQLSQKETLKNITECDLNAAVTLTCGGDEIIAIHSLQYAYNVRCTEICCNTYTSTDCFVQAESTDIQDLRRDCSGQSSCNAPIPQGNIDFVTCSLGLKVISYLFLQYYCIPKGRVSSVCTNEQTLTSDGAPLYLTNENYPSVTTGGASCDCSLEVYSCSSSINMYIIDADLYLDTTTCLQNLDFLDGSNTKLHTIGCESHYSNQIENNTANSHYLKIDFFNNSTANQEGFFFIGLEASESGAFFSLSCSFEQETWCVGCGDVPVIANGNVELSNVNDSSYNAAANVTCESGYETNTSTINCLANGTWPEPVCTEKDCGTLPALSSGHYELVSSSTTFGSFARVICDTGYTADKLNVTCQSTGIWESAVCTIIGCGDVPVIANGNIELSNVNDSSYNAAANVTCDSGYETNTSTINCLANGTWPEPVCTEKAACTASQWRCTNGDCISDSGICDNLPDCEDNSDEDNCNDCGTVPPIPNGVITSEVNSTIGSAANVTCNEGYSASVQTVTCLTNGSWETASCTAHDCGTLPALSSGRYELVGSSSKFGASARVICDTGYTADKPNVTCQSTGIWESAVCTLIDCETLPALSSGRYVLVSLSTTFGASARVVCDKGYTADKLSVTCKSTGIWESSVCTLIDCGTLPGVANGIVTLNNVNKTMFADTASVACDQGYRPVKVAITCQASGKWETSLCKTAGKNISPHGGSKDNKQSISLVLIIVLVILGLLLVQLAIMCFLQCKIHNIRSKAEGRDAEISKRIVMTIYGSIPVIGIIPICMTLRVFYTDVYQVTHSKHTQEPMIAISNNGYSDINLDRNETIPTEDNGVNENEIELERQETEKHLRMNNIYTDNTTGEQIQSSTMSAASSSDHKGKED